MTRRLISRTRLAHRPTPREPADPDSLRIIVLSYSASGFAMVRDVCETQGHRVVAYAYARSLQPGQPSSPQSGPAVKVITASMPPGVDLLLPGNPARLLHAIQGHEADLLICNGFPWRLPPEVLAAPVLGCINIHHSLLPRHRGPIPVQWALRSGDPETGVTIHRMTDRFDAGSVLAQRGGVVLGDDFDPDALTEELDDVAHDLLPVALARVVGGELGEKQNEAAATYGTWMDDTFRYVDWGHTARQVHNQVRTFKYGVPNQYGPIAEIDGRHYELLRTSLHEPADDSGALRAECADAPLWVVSYSPWAAIRQ